ncbi:uncharacterized protein LOC144086699 isoform X2 [Stigmatopora argus]
MAHQSTTSAIDNILFQLASEARELTQRKNDINQEIEVNKTKIARRRTCIETTRADIKTLKENADMKQNNLNHNRALAKSMKVTQGMLLQYERTLKLELENIKANYNNEKDVYEEKMASYRKLFHDHQMPYVLNIQVQNDDMESSFTASQDEVTTVNVKEAGRRACVTDFSVPRSTSDEDPECELHPHPPIETVTQMEHSPIEGSTAAIQAANVDDAKVRLGRRLRRGFRVGRVSAHCNGHSYVRAVQKLLRPRNFLAEHGTCPPGCPMELRAMKMLLDQMTWLAGKRNWQRHHSEKQGCRWCWRKTRKRSGKWRKETQLWKKSNRRRNTAPLFLQRNPNKPPSQRHSLCLKCQHFPLTLAQLVPWKALLKTNLQASPFRPTLTPAPPGSLASVVTMVEMRMRRSCSAAPFSKIRQNRRINQMVWISCSISRIKVTISSCPSPPARRKTVTSTLPFHSKIETVTVHFFQLPVTNLKMFCVVVACFKSLNK